MVIEDVAERFVGILRFGRNLLINQVFALQFFSNHSQVLDRGVA
jgi:hypothetical protein